jgi:GNAT superfamily N-acetyltransferase
MGVRLLFDMLCGKPEYRIMMIRLATAIDDISVRAVQRSTWDATYRGMLPDWVVDQIVKPGPVRPVRWQSVSQDVRDSRRVYIAENPDGQIIGFTACGLAREPLPGYPGEIWAVYVLPACQGKGVGRALLEAAVVDLQSRGLAGIQIWTLEANRPARNFYERMGWHQLEESRFFEVSGERIAREIGYGYRPESLSKPLE